LATKIIIRTFNPDEMPKLISKFWNIKKYKNVLTGINEDDCAVIKIGSEQLVVSTDYLNANPIALEFGIGTFKDLGRLLVAANLSDLCGSGAKPIGFLASVMFRKKEASEKNFLLLMAGIKLELSKYKIPLLGGDTKLGNSNSFCGTALGIKEKGTKLFLKNGAKPGDNIWVSGNIGSVAAAIDILQENEVRGSLINWAKNKIIVPNIPLKKSRLIAKSKAANSGTDLSDGLGSDLATLCTASNVGAIIDVANIPLENQVVEIANQKKVDAWKYAFTIGGDFQFIITANKNKDFRRCGLKKIGQIYKERKLQIAVKNEIYELSPMGHTDYNIRNFKNEVSKLIATINIR
jgi:thiamine-monophosphate kinase